MLTEMNFFLNIAVLGNIELNIINLSLKLLQLCLNLTGFLDRFQFAITSRSYYYSTKKELSANTRRSVFYLFIFFFFFQRASEYYSSRGPVCRFLGFCAKSICSTHIWEWDRSKKNIFLKKTKIVD